MGPFLSWHPQPCRSELAAITHCPGALVRSGIGQSSIQQSSNQISQSIINSAINHQSRNHQSSTKHQPIKKFTKFIPF
jgi:hypothetical protein